MNMKKIALALVLGCAFVITVGVTPAAAEKVNITIGTGLPDGMTVFVTAGGEGCNCVGSASGVVSGGKVTISLDIRCTTSGRPPVSGPNANVRIFARALNEKANQQYKGEDKITPTFTSGVYQSSFNLIKVPPIPGDR